MQCEVSLPKELYFYTRKVMDMTDVRLFSYLLQRTLQFPFLHCDLSFFSFNLSIQLASVEGQFLWITGTNKQSTLTNRSVLFTEPQYFFQLLLGMCYQGKISLFFVHNYVSNSINTQHYVTKYAKNISSTKGTSRFLIIIEGSFE